MLVDGSTPERFLKRHSPDDFVVVVVTTIHLLRVGSQMRIDEAQQGFVQLEAHSDSSFVTLE